MTSSSAKNRIKVILARIGLLTPLHRIWAFSRRTIDGNLVVWRAWRCRRNYTIALKRIRNKPKGEKIRVLFLVGEPAKWKCQKLYEAMRDSGEFEPLIGLTAWNAQGKQFCSDDMLDSFHKKAEVFFNDLGDQCVRTYGLYPREYLELSIFSPDIVFYSEPWCPSRRQSSEIVSKFALTFFIPYFVPSHGSVAHEAQHELHRFLFEYICLNDEWARIYQTAWRKWNSSVSFVGLGHPALDFYLASKESEINKNAPIVYAPHYSFPHPGNQYAWAFSTFDWSGKAILAYAMEHRDMGWVFKPHPLLRVFLEKTGVMAKEEIDAYWNAWAAIGIVCESGDYQRLFLNSRAMVTDSCSFLVEYGATGRPLIHLVRKDNGVVPLPPSKALFDSLYKVENLEQLFNTFECVLEKGLDAKRDERLKAVCAARISGCDASKAIVEHLKGLAGR